MAQERGITLPRLDGLRPTLESTALKLMEEAGELGAAIGKVRGMSGESGRWPEKAAMDHVALELLDVAQTAVTMMFVLEGDFGLDARAMLDEHMKKLREKGYLSMVEA